MSTLANYMRITGIQVSDQDVDSRKVAIAALKAAWTKNPTFDSVFVKVTDTAAALSGDGTPSETLGKAVEVAVQKKSSSFLYSERPLDVGIVAGMVVTEILAGPPNASGWLWPDVWAAALWSALSFQPPLADTKREELRVNVLNAARERSISGAEVARQRVKVPDFGAVSLTPGEENKLGDTVKNATHATIDALRRNSALDREELDFLWWSQMRRSRLLNRPLEAMGEIVRVVAAGIEGAGHLRRMPCEVHREIVLRTIDANPTADLPGLLEALEPHREILVKLYVGKISVNEAALFPLLYAISNWCVDDTAASKIKRTAEEWGARALLEAALLNMRVSGPGTL